MLKPGWMERSQLRRRTFLQASASWLGTQWLGLHSAQASSKESPIESGICSPFQRQRSDGSLWLAERYALRGSTQGLQR